MEKILKSLRKLFVGLNKDAQKLLISGLCVLTFTLVTSTAGLIFLIALNPLAGALLISFITGLVALFKGGNRKK